MEVIRRDFLIERYSVISRARGKRPHQFQPKPRVTKGKICFFCSGNESLTPPTIDRYPKDGAWEIRVFRNKFPALKPPNGDHEIIVETNKHGKELEDLTPEGMLQAFRMYEKRRMALETKYKYVSVFKNKGREAGASLPHSHTQVIASALTPTVVMREDEAAKHYYNKWHRCPWCDYVDGIKTNRVAMKSKHSIAITANAPRFAFEVWVMPKRHVGDFSDLNADEALDFCGVLKDILLKLREKLGYVSYNIAFHHKPKGSKNWFHFHVEVMPRLSTHAGYELGEGVYIVDTTPEEAASFYRS